MEQEQAAPVDPELFRPVDYEGMANIFRETGQLHFLAIYPRVVAEPMLAYLTPSELEIVLTEMSRLHEEGAQPSGEDRNHPPANSHVPGRPGSVDEQHPQEPADEPLPIVETDDLVDLSRPSDFDFGGRSLTARSSQ